MQEYTNLPLPASTRLAPNILIRPATLKDTKAMSKCFFTSFTPSHPFWNVIFPEKLYDEWWVEAWRMGIEDDATARTYVAIDVDALRQAGGNVGKADELMVDEGKLVGFSRWIVPQPDGNLHRLWPDLPEGADMEVCGPFFGGMEDNRSRLMGSRPHWFLEMLGTDTSYQRTGLGHTFVSWGCELADRENMEVYIDASMKGAPFYEKYFGAKPQAVIDLPVRPESYGEFVYVSQVRPSQSEREKSMA